MKGRHFAAILVTGCVISAVGGYWLGFRDAWPLGAAAEALPSGVLASEKIQMLRAGQASPLTRLLESDVDRGLVYGYDIVNHPLRGLWKPVWGIDVYPKYERYVSRLADYRIAHPSTAKSDDLPQTLKETPEVVREIVRQDLVKRDKMIDRYATKR